MVYEPFDYGSNAAGTPYANTTGTPLFQGYTNPSNGLTWASAFNTAAARGHDFFRRQS